MMTLEEMLVKDREAFEKTVSVEKNAAEQCIAGMALFGRFIDDVLKSKENAAYVHTRIDYFMFLCIKDKVAAPLVLHVLRSTVASAEQYLNRPALVTYCNFLNEEPELFSTAAVLKELPNANEYAARRTALLNRLDENSTSGLSVTKLVELKKLCHEYQDWLDSINEGRATANPKNYPTTDQLRVRDSIHKKIVEIATPDLLLKLVTQALSKETSAE